MPRIVSHTPIAGSGLSTEAADAIFAQIDRFAGYGFNKSHAAAYAAIAYQTAYLRTHHPAAFFAASMNVHLDDVEDLAVHVDELKRRGLELAAPCVQSSAAIFVPERLDDGRCILHYGLAALRGVGRTAADAIVTARMERPFSSLEDFLGRVDGSLSRTALKALAKSGALDPLEADRGAALAAMDAPRPNHAQMTMFEMMDAVADRSAPPLDRETILDNELDVLGHFMSDHPLSPLPQDARDCVFHADLAGMAHPPRTARMAAIVTKYDVRRTNKGTLMAVLTLSDPSGLYEAIAFDETWGHLRGDVRKGARLACEMTISMRGDTPRFLIDRVTPIGQTKDKAA